MPAYLVIWQLEIEADSPYAAAVEAREIQTALYTGATHFEVCRDGVVTRIDTSQEDVSASVLDIDDGGTT